MKSMDTVRNLRLAFRMLRRNLSTTAIAVVSISLSVAATAVVFAAIKSVLLAPLPYAHPERLVQIGSEFGDKARPSIVDFGFWNDAQEIARRNRTLQSVAVYGNALSDLAGDGSTPPEALYGLVVSANLFPTLGVKPMLGRNILPQEDQPERENEMILSYGLWVRRFNADRNIVGRDIQVDSHNCRVIGVMAPGFNFPLQRAAAHTPSPYVEFWSPIHRHEIGAGAGIGIIARLRDGVSLQAAKADLASIDTALKHDFSGTNNDRTLRLGLLRDRMLGRAAKSLWLLLGAASVFLLIGCANVANLLLARGNSRKREMAIRIAVGASNAHIIRQLLLESCILAGLGGLGGYALTVIAWRTLPALAPVNIPRLGATHADWVVFVFAFTVALLCGVVFGLAPSLRATFATRICIREAHVNALGARRDRLRSSLVISEVALAITLVVIGAQLTHKFIGLLRTDPGFDADHVVASVIVPSNERKIDPQQRAVIYERFLDALPAIPGVTSAGAVDALPFSGENFGGFIAADAAQAMQPGTQTLAEIDDVSADYLQTMGVRLLRGRWFNAGDMKQSNASAIISDAAAQRLWPGKDPLGRRICVDCTPEKPNNWKQVVGVVSTIRHASMDDSPDLNVYLSAGALEKAVFLVVRTDRPRTGLDNAIRRAIASVDPNQPVFYTASMHALISDWLADRRFIMLLLGATALLALLMAAAGVYGVVSYTTSRRTQEIGLRIALGASRGRVHMLIFRQGFAVVIFGAVIGAGLTWALLRVLHGITPGLDASYAATFGIAIGLVLAASATACFIPARRAAKVDPMVALRYE